MRVERQIPMQLKFADGAMPPGWLMSSLSRECFGSVQGRSYTLVLASIRFIFPYTKYLYRGFSIRT